MRTWFITGTSSGFGRQMTELLLERGDRVAATLRNPVRLDDLAARHGDRLWRAGAMLRTCGSVPGGRAKGVPSRMIL
ncbi:hypothetical protein [Streptomyces mirabilis]|uniref:hypothetical protein n=1 Tax=Streptomyces mirabilis TaxID=68239 RepID=UPI002253776B|nr:hypothetical protein [Streptomyces mirabilis]MCX4418474.1 hypothetical protein [Streptomyces mirabilis]